MINLFIILSVYFVTFTDKPEKTAPQLSPRAVEQRAKWNIQTDAMDYPVSPMYMNKVREAGGKILHYSRWFNGATVEMDKETAAKVAELKCVESIEMTRDDSEPDYYLPKRRARQREQATEALQAYTDAQLALYNLTALHEAGFEGQGILMAICDGSFYNADKVECFRQDQLLGHFDLTDDADKGYPFFGTTGDHGTECLSTISGIREDYYGAATKAQYYLMRSEEEETESPKEMDNLVAALEKADSLGVNIFSVSLGYVHFDNPEWDIPKSAFDGRSTRASLAATIAARKGMLVCIAAGNEGDEWGNPPHTLGIPADADSTLTVGAVNTSGIIGGFSSYGPTSDLRVKPEVCAVGVKATLVNHANAIMQANGTSFATPLLAGFAAALWSALPDENAMQIRERILLSSNRYDDPDTENYQYGYGIPDAWKAYQLDIPTGIDGVQSTETAPQKILRDGQLLIIKENRKYNILGSLVP